MASFPLLQDLEPRQARLCLTLERFVREELGVELRGRRVVVGFSGGPDSTALLAVLRLLAPRLELTLTAACLDHGLRHESAAEVETAAACCERLGVAFVGERRDVAALARDRKLGVEDAGRLARWEYLDRVRREGGGGLVALAQQLNDLAEDVLMRLVRGAGWPGLAGMRGFCPERELVRPLLLTPRARLIEFLESLELSWVEDPSNQDERFLRNRVRKRVVPLLEAENPAFLEAVASFWRLGRLDDEFWDGEVTKHFSHAISDDCDLYNFTRKSLDQIPSIDCRQKLFLDDEMLQKVSAALRLRLYKAALDRLGPGQALVRNLLRADRLWRERATGSRVQFPGEKTMELTSRGVLFRRTQAGESTPSRGGIVR